MTAALEGDEWSAALAALYPQERLGTHFTGGWVGPRGRSGRVENLIPTGIRSRTVQPIVSHYTNWATRPTLQLYTVSYLEQGRQCTYNVTLKHVHITTVAVEQQYVLHNLSTNFSLRYPASKAHALYYIVICGPSGYTAFFYIIS